MDNPGIGPEQLKKLMDDVNSSGNFRKLFPFLSDDVRFRVTIPVGTPVSGEFVGKESVEEYFIKTLPGLAEFKQEVELEVFASGNKIILLGDDSYIVKKNSGKYRSPYAFVFELKEGKITDMLIIQDLSGIYDAYKK